MPYRWMPPPSPTAPVARLRLWPHRSLPPQGFAAFIGITFILLMVPVLALLGKAALWGILPFPLAALALTWVLLRRSYHPRLGEELTVSPERATLVHSGADGRRQEWEANPYWLRVVLHAHGGPVENYLTLEGGPRVVEIGAFLSPEERVELQPQLADAFSRRAVR
jgi:uncharacterized membrane protein